MTTEDLRFEPLPPKHTLTREEVRYSQRERLLAAIVELVAERGYDGVTLLEIKQTARVAGRTFHEIFSSKEDCLLAAFEIIVDHLHSLLHEAAGPERDWTADAIAGIREILHFFAQEPAMARFGLVEVPLAGHRPMLRYQEAVLGFAPLLRTGREQPGCPADLPDSTETAVLGAAASLLARSLEAGTPSDDIERLFPDVASFLLTPYLGAEEAALLVAGEAATE